MSPLERKIVLPSSWDGDASDVTEHFCSSLYTRPIIYGHYTLQVATQCNSRKRPHHGQPIQGVAQCMLVALN